MCVCVCVCARARARARAYAYTCICARVLGTNVGLKFMHKMESSETLHVGQSMIEWVGFYS